MTMAVTPHPRNPFPGLVAEDHEALMELERWGQEQRRDAVRALMDALPGPLRAVVRCRLPWVP